MATLADRLFSKGKWNLGIPGTITPPVYQEIKNGFKDSLREAEIINAENVLDYWVENVGSRVERGGKLDSRIDFPNVAPVFPSTFFQANVSKTIHAKEKYTGISSFGVLIRVIFDYKCATGQEADAWRKLAEDMDFLNNTRWLCSAETVVEYGNRDILLVPAILNYPVASDGSLAMKENGVQAFSFTSMVNDYVSGEDYWPTNGIDMQESIDEIGWDMTIQSALPFFLALSLMHCKNVTLEDVEPPLQQSKKHAKHHGLPLVSYKVLQIDPMKIVLQQEGHINETGMNNALHICRGHFKDYSDRGLFGKYHGMYWWDAFVRGAETHGLVLKDYNIKLPVDNPEQEELDLGIEPAPYEAGVVVERGKTTSKVTVRPDQSRLREQLLRAYGGCCAVTGCSEPSAVQTAHIRPVENGGPDDIRNAILLESDVHDLWDAGKIYIEPITYVIRVHPDVEWPDYRKLDGQKLSLPRDAKNWPDPNELQYHRTFCDF